jgi:hypothetical protein
VTLMRRLFGGISDEGLAAAVAAGTSSPLGTASRTRSTRHRRLHGCAGATLLGHGFRIDTLADLVGDGLATARRETEKVGKRKITVARIYTPDVGQRAIEG